MISTLLQRSTTHLNCEDSSYWQEKGDFIYGGVFDGCSSAMHSHWASRSLAYLFAKGFSNPTTNYKCVEVFYDMKQLMSVMGISDMSLVSTCLLFSYNMASKVLCVRSFGDGYIYINGKEYDLDQDNTPDYLVYATRTNNILEYLDKYPIMTFEDVNDFSITSDGIKRVEVSQFKEPTDKDPLSILLAPPTGENYLKRMWNKLSKEGYYLTDDLSIISYVQDEIR